MSIPDFGTGLALASPAVAPDRVRSLAALLPSVVELLCVVAAIAAMLPLFDRVAELGPGRDQRFLDRGIVVSDLPEPVLNDVCRARTEPTETTVSTFLCTVPPRAAGRTTAPAAVALAHAIERASQAFSMPVRDADRRIEALRRSAQEGAADLRDEGDAIAGIEAEIAPFVERFRLTADRDAGPMPLSCAARWLAATTASTRIREDAGQRIARADFELLLAAALDGRTTAPALGADARLPSASVPGCPGAFETLTSTAALMADARQALANEHKNEAMRSLLRSAGSQWAAAMAIGYCLLLWSRRTRRPAFGIAVSLAVWSGAAWLARVPWPLGGSRVFVPGRLDASYFSAPAPFVLYLLGAAVVLAIASFGHRRREIGSLVPQSMSSRVGYPGLVVATGIGWLLLFDLSLNGHAGNRYLALYHQGHLWLAMLVFSVLLFLRQPLAHGIAWALSVVGEAARRVAQSVGRRSAALALVVATAVCILGFGFALSNMRQLTSELGRVWLIVGAAWFFFLRAGPLAERLARSGPAGLSFLRYAWPLLFVVAVLIGAMFVTRDMGPLLIAGYASGAFVAAVGRDVVAPAQRPGAASARARDVAVCGVDRRRDLGAFPGRRVRQRHGEPARERRRAVRVDQRPAGAGVLVPARRAGRGLRHRHDAVVRLCARGQLQRRAGADPQRLHLHGDRRACSGPPRRGRYRSAVRSGCIG